MKKTLLVIVLVCAALGAASAQEGAGGAAAATMSDVGLLNVNTYSSLFLNGGGRLDPKGFPKINRYILFTKGLIV
jgi:hypothetical protein